jgi:hypothetical protein
MAQLKDDAEMGPMAYSEVQELEGKLRMAGEVLALMHGILVDLVGTLSEEARDEYADDLTRIEDLTRLIH